MTTKTYRYPLSKSLGFLGALGLFAAYLFHYRSTSQVEWLGQLREALGSLGMLCLFSDWVLPWRHNLSTIVFSDDEISCRRWYGRTSRVRFSDISAVIPVRQYWVEGEYDYRIYDSNGKYVMCLGWRLSDSFDLFTLLKQRTPHLSTVPQPAPKNDPIHWILGVGLILISAASVLALYVDQSVLSWVFAAVIIPCALVVLFADVASERRKISVDVFDDRVVIRKRETEIVYPFAELQEMTFRVNDDGFSRFYSVSMTGPTLRDTVSLGKEVPEGVAEEWRKKWEAFLARNPGARPQHNL